MKTAEEIIMESVDFWRPMGDQMDNMKDAMHQYAAQAVNLALYKAAEFAQNQQLRDQPVYGRDIMLLEKSIIKKLK